MYFWGDIVQHIVRPLAYFTEKYNNGYLLDIFVDTKQLELLRELHALYWDGVRYDRDRDRYDGG